MTDLSQLSTAQPQNMADNFVRLNKTDDPRYQEVLDEFQRRVSPSLDINKSMAAILAAAKRQAFISYGDVAEANGLGWSFAMNRLMPKHLDLILAKADARGMPLITAIVVNKPNIRTGKLEEASLKGFTAGAARLGYEVGDPEAFLDDQQRETFQFAKNYEG